MLCKIPNKMGSRKPEKSSKHSVGNPSKLTSKSHFKKKKDNERRSHSSNAGGRKKQKQDKRGSADTSAAHTVDNVKIQSDCASGPLVTASQQLSYFLDQYQSANAIKLSSLELESFNDACILDLSQGSDPDEESLSKKLKAAFGSSWKQELCQKNLVDGKVDPGSPAVLVVSTSAVRLIELLRGFRSLTQECHAAKLFSKHIKVEEQIAVLKNRVNIAGGTPSRLKKLIDMESLGLSRLSVLLLDMQVDVKGYSLLTLPQVRDEFWDLYKNFFHQRLAEGKMRICLYGPIQEKARTSRKKGASRE